MITEDKLTMCKNCNSNLCYENIVGDIKVWTCATCGFTTNSILIKDSDFYKKQFELLPEIYKVLSFTDDENKVWFPNYIYDPGTGVVYLEGTDVEDIKWVGIKDTLIKEEELRKYPPGTKYKPDMSTKKEFEVLSYIEAILYIFGNKY